MSPPRAGVSGSAERRLSANSIHSNVDLSASAHLGWGVALWLACERADSLYQRLSDYGLEMIEPPFDGPFGRTFSLIDPFGYRLTLFGSAG